MILFKTLLFNGKDTNINHLLPIFCDKIKIKTLKSNVFTRISHYFMQNSLLFYGSNKSFGEHGTIKRANYDAHMDAFLMKEIKKNILTIINHETNKMKAVCKIWIIY